MHSILSDDPVWDTVRMRYELSGVADQRGKIARMLEKGDLIALRRGIYATRRDLDPHCLAGSIYGPSYVSFETALAWHGMIPEGVSEILSATVKRRASFENDFGRFRYLTIPKSAYPIGIGRVTDSDAPFLIATPAKALADRIAREPGFRSVVEVGRWLEGMRVEREIPLHRGELEGCAATYGRPAVRWLLRWAVKYGVLQS